MKSWERFERDIQQRFGLSATLSSGNQFFDSGDAVDNRHPSESAYPMWIECKWTGAKSRSVKAQELDSWRERAELLGKRFVLALRFYDALRPRLSADYVLITVEDFEDLLVLAGAREKECSGQ
jgi:hypothetical protein